MFAPHHDFFLALAGARKAARRGDVATVERWLKCAERHLVLVQRLDDIIREQDKEAREASWRARLAELNKQIETLF